MQLSPAVDIVPVLGIHPWARFMSDEFIEASRRACETTNFKLDPFVPWKHIYKGNETYLKMVATDFGEALPVSKRLESVIYEYNWKQNGDPEQKRMLPGCSKGFNYFLTVIQSSGTRYTLQTQITLHTSL